jgi:hypothetical protein
VILSRIREWLLLREALVRATLRVLEEVGEEFGLDELTLRSLATYLSISESLSVFARYQQARISELHGQGHGCRRIRSSSSARG